MDGQGNKMCKNMDSQGKKVRNNVEDQDKTKCKVMMNAYLILVANATNSVSVKIFKWEEFFDNECKILHHVCNFTVYCFTHSV